MGRRQNTTTVMLRSERQGWKSGEWVIKGDWYHSFHWIIVYTVITKRMLARIHLYILDCFGSFCFFCCFKAWGEHGYTMSERVGEKRASMAVWSSLQPRERWALFRALKSIVPVWHYPLVEFSACFRDNNHFVLFKDRELNLCPWATWVWFSSCSRFWHISGWTLLERTCPRCGSAACAHLEFLAPWGSRGILTVPHSNSCWITCPRCRAVMCSIHFEEMGLCCVLPHGLVLVLGRISSELDEVLRHIHNSSSFSHGQERRD